MMTNKTVSVAYIQCQVLMDLLEESKNFVDKDLAETIDETISIVKVELAREENKTVTLTKKEYKQLVSSSKIVLGEVANEDGDLWIEVEALRKVAKLRDGAKRLYLILKELEEI